MKSVLPNLGFVLQTAGLTILLAVPVAVAHNEQLALISFLVTAVVFLGSGFLMNALSQRRELDFKAACILVTLAYLLLGVIGAVPYIYTNAFADASLGARVVNGLFESISGYTTTGLSMVTTADNLPRSIAFYRGLTQWIGGINIVFIFLVFFYSEQVLGDVSRAMGLNPVTATLRRSYVRVFFIYAGYTLLFFGLLYWAGVRDLTNNIALVFSTVSTGGFSPVTDFSALLSFPVFVLLLVLMVLGATSFSVHYGLFARKIDRLLVAEFVAMILIICAFALGLAWLTGLDMPAAFFHVTSATSTTGFQYIDLPGMAANAKMLFVILMLVGGSAFSTAGGIKVMRVLVFFASVPWAVRGLMTGRLDNLVVAGKEFRPADIVAWWLVIIGAGLIIMVSAFIFTLYGFTLANAVFELTSAFATVGLSVGVTSITLPSGLKLLLALVMLLGRIELIPFLVALTARPRVSPPQ